MDIKEIPRWICWKRKGEGTKVPTNKFGEPDSCLNPINWMSFDEASEAFELYRSHVDGIGFVIDGSDGVCGVDLDDASHQWDVKEWALPIYEKLKKTYHEISPSMTGLKFWGIGKRPADSKTQVKVSHGSIECYDSGRWFAWTGLHLGAEPMPVVDIQEEIDWLYATYFPKSQTQEIKERAHVVSVYGGGGSFDNRLRGYIAACQADPITNGERNNRLFKIAAGLMEFEHDGQRLSESQLRDWVSEVNAGLSEPLPDEEIAAMVRSVTKRPPRAIKENRPMELAMVPGVDLSSIISSLEPSPEPTLTPLAAEPFPMDCLFAPGFIGTFVSEMLESALYPQPQIAWGAAMSLLSVITGRKIEDYQGTRTNLYFVAVAPTASGKEHYRGCVMQVLEEAGGGDLIGHERIASNAGLVSKLMVHPSSLWCLDELGRMLEAIRKSDGKAAHLHSIVSVLLQLYSSANRTWRGDAYADPDRNPVINQPHLTVYGSTTPEAFWDSLDGRSLQDGFVGRLSPVYGSYVDRNVSAAKYLPSPQVVEFVRSWVNYNPGGGDLSADNPVAAVIQRSDEAHERWCEHVDGINDRRRHEPAERAAIWSRVAERSAKFAMLYAVSRMPDGDDLVRPISIADMDRAIKASNWIARAMLREWTEKAMSTDHERLFVRVKAAISEACQGKLTPRWRINRSLRFVNARTRDEIITQLIESGEVAVSEVDGKVCYAVV